MNDRVSNTPGTRTPPRHTSERRFEDARKAAGTARPSGRQGQPSQASAKPIDPSTQQRIWSAATGVSKTIRAADDVFRKKGATQEELAQARQSLKDARESIVAAHSYLKPYAQSRQAVETLKVIGSEQDGDKKGLLAQLNRRLNVENTPQYNPKQSSDMKVGESDPSFVKKENFITGTQQNNLGGLNNLTKSFMENPLGKVVVNSSPVAWVASIFVGRETVEKTSRDLAAGAANAAYDAGVGLFVRLPGMVGALAVEASVKPLAALGGNKNVYAPGSKNMFDQVNESIDATLGDKGVKGWLKQQGDTHLGVKSDSLTYNAGYGVGFIGTTFTGAGASGLLSRISQFNKLNGFIKFISKITVDAAAKG